MVVGRDKESIKKKRAKKEKSADQKVDIQLTKDNGHGFVDARFRLAGCRCGLVAEAVVRPGGRFGHDRSALVAPDQRQEFGAELRGLLDGVLAASIHAST
jgi:hypothetical protein